MGPPALRPVPESVPASRDGLLILLDALDLERVDLLGFSIGSFVAQEIALIRPQDVRRVVLASAAPQGAAGMHGWAPEVIEAVGGRARSADGYLGVFYTRSEASRQSRRGIVGAHERAQRGPRRPDELAGA